METSQTIFRGPWGGEDRGKFPEQQTRSTWCSFSPFQCLPSLSKSSPAPCYWQLVERRKKKPTAAPLSVIYAAASVHLFPFPSLQGQLLPLPCSHETATLMVDAARSWCRGGTGSVASAPARIKRQRSSLALPSQQPCNSPKKAQPGAEPLPRFRGPEIVRDKHAAFLCFGTRRVVLTSFAGVGTAAMAL